MHHPPPIQRHRPPLTKSGKNGTEALPFGFTASPGRWRESRNMSWSIPWTRFGPTSRFAPPAISIPPHTTLRRKRCPWWPKEAAAVAAAVLLPGFPVRSSSRLRRRFRHQKSQAHRRHDRHRPKWQRRRSGRDSWAVSGETDHTEEEDSTTCR